MRVVFGVVMKLSTIHIDHAATSHANHFCTTLGPWPGFISFHAYIGRITRSEGCISGAIMRLRPACYWRKRERCSAWTG
jgi:hypothetical protein